MKYKNISVVKLGIDLEVWVACFYASAVHWGCSNKQAKAVYLLKTESLLLKCMFTLKTRKKMCPLNNQPCARNHTAFFPWTLVILFKVKQNLIYQHLSENILLKVNIHFVFQTICFPLLNNPNEKKCKMWRIRGMISILKCIFIIVYTSLYNWNKGDASQKTSFIIGQSAQCILSHFCRWCHAELRMQI